MSPLQTFLVLFVTHFAAFAAGGATMKWLITRRLRVTEVDGHLALEVTPRPCHDSEGSE